MSQNKPKKLLNIIFFLSIVGILISGYLTYIHYSKNSSPCDVSTTLSCSTVNRSKYAEILGIPVALIGLLGYFLLWLLSLLLLKQEYWTKKFQENSSLKKIFTKIISEKFIFHFSLLMLLFSFYLSYAEFFLLQAICILCVGSQLTILGVTIVSYRSLQYRGELNEYNQKEFQN